MVPRHDKPTKKKDSVRFVVISPKASGPLSFSDRLFEPANLSIPRRAGAVLITAACFCAGSVLVAFFARDLNWVFGILGLLAVVYGVGWARVSLEGKLPGGRLRLNPWRRK
jgi:hypothetical protein